MNANHLILHSSGVASHPFALISGYEPWFRRVELPDADVPGSGQSTLRIIHR